MLQNQWYLVCPAEDIKDQILSKTIIGERIIIFRDKQGSISALEDRCCHRNVQLSLGYYQQGHVVCGYHGWEYDGNGNCVKIPSQLSDTKIPPTAKIKSYPVKELNKWLWVFVGDPQKADQVKAVDIPEMGTWPFTYNSHLIKSDLEVAAESLIDPYHIAFVHRNSIGSFMGQIKEFPADFNLKVLEDGLEGSYNRANVGTMGEKMYFGDAENHDTFYRFYYPSISRLQINFKERTLLILENIFKVDDDHVEMMQITLWDNIFPKFPAFARWFMARKSDKIVNEDIDFLESNLKLRRESDKELFDVSVKGDEISLAFRKYWRMRMKEGESVG